MKAQNGVEVLIAEDSPTQALQLRTVLEHDGYTVTVVRNGEEALTLARERPPDLIVSDIVMPICNGYELCRKVKADQRLKAIPVILLTSLSDPIDVVRALECGADNFIFKSCDEGSLLTQIAYTLEHPNESPQPVIEIPFKNQRFRIASTRCQVLNILLSTYDAAVRKNLDLIETRDDLADLSIHLEEKVRERTDALEAEIAVRKRNEHQLKEQARLLDLSQDAIIVHDLDDKVVFWSKGAEQLYGWTSQEMVGQSHVELIYADKLLFEAGKKELLATDYWNGELTHLSKSGKKIIVNSRGTLVRDEDGKPDSILMIHTNITEKKKLEEQFLRAQRMESIGTLASGVAHDLNNILSPILMGASMLREQLPDGAESSMLSMIEEAAQRGADIVKQVQTFTRGVEGRRVLLQSKHLTREIENIIRPTFPKSISIVNSTARDLWAVTADATQLHQVLLNLCVNARDAMPHGGKLVLAARNQAFDEDIIGMTPEAKAGSYVVFSVSDSGTGIPREVIDKIFDPFFTTKELGKGTGLGLSTVIGIVRSHGGFVTVESEAGKGSTFRVFIPATMATQAAAGCDEVSALPRGNGELILLVDDEEPIRQAASAVLVKSGYRVITACDGTEALTVYSQRGAEIRLVLADVTMPFMDGVSMIRVLKKMDPCVNVIASTGDGDQFSGKELKAIGIDAILRKPYNADVLLKSIDQLIRGSDAATELEAGNGSVAPDLGLGRGASEAAMPAAAFDAG